MKRNLIICGLALILVIFLLGTASFAQSTPAQPQQDSGKQWRSHQMYQPPPETSARYKLSQRAVDEITQLYELALKESDAKPAKAK